jgi:hypothetical protein
MAKDMSCLTMTTVGGCRTTAAGVQSPILIHTQYGMNAAGSVIVVATRYTDAANVPFAPAGTDVIVSGDCAGVKVDVEFKVLCDDADNNASTANIPFLRRIERVYNASTGVLITQTVTNTTLDAVTAYVPLGAISANCAGDFEYDEEIVCDTAGVSWIRRTTQVNGTISATIGFFNPTTGVSGTPTGAVGACPTCAPSIAQGVLSTWG